METLSVLPGRGFPLGATADDSGVHFAVFSRHAGRVWLALYHGPADVSPFFEIELNPKRHRLGDVWTVYIKGLRAGVLYRYRMAGPPKPSAGEAFDPCLYLLDPYAKAVTGDMQNRRAKCLVTRDVVVSCDDPPLRTPMHETIIYETHVRGFTAHPSAHTAAPGTYRGFIEKLSYLKDLGVTAVELLPVHTCGEWELARRNPITGERLVNYWGYNPIALFAPDERYAQPGRQLEEFRELTAALHGAGIEVILDVVFNHTSEGDRQQQTLSFRGIDNAVYYLLDSAGKHRDFTGCGNTLQCGHAVVADLIVDCLRHWVTTYRVDGVRFDLATVLNRGRDGALMTCSPLVERISEDPVLRDLKLIAEPWDLGGAYQVGTFGTPRWADWNARYRDDVRRFWRGDEGMKPALAQRLTGSADLFKASGKSPAQSINYVAAHDGFTLRDLVSYNHKHNEANGESNGDGSGENYSWNCGVEGESNDAAVNALRMRMQKNFLATLFLSLGTPMLLGGDEFGRTQRGNNNAYCQDNEISWYDWTLLERHQELHRFCRQIIRFRKENRFFSLNRFPTGEPVSPGGLPDVAWFDVAGKPQTWSTGDLTLACRIDARVNGGAALYLALNPSTMTREFVLPVGSWRLRVDTGRSAPADMPDIREAPTVQTDRLLVRSKSMVVLAASPQS